MLQTPISWDMVPNSTSVFYVIYIYIHWNRTSKKRFPLMYSDVPQYTGMRYQTRVGSYLVEFIQFLGV